MNKEDLLSDHESEKSITEEMTEVYLPQTEKLLPFFSLSDQDKYKVIELGLCFLQSGNNQKQFWNNKEWEGKIQDIEKHNTIMVQSLQEQIQKEKQNSVFLVEQFREQKELLTNEVRENV